MGKIYHIFKKNQKDFYNTNILYTFANRNLTKNEYETKNVYTKTCGHK